MTKDRQLRHALRQNLEDQDLFQQLMLDSEEIKIDFSGPKEQTSPNIQDLSPIKLSDKSAIGPRAFSANRPSEQVKRRIENRKR